MTHVLSFEEGSFLVLVASCLSWDFSGSKKIFTFLVDILRLLLLLLLTRHWSIFRKISRQSLNSNLKPAWNHFLYALKYYCCLLVIKFLIPLKLGYIICFSPTVFLFTIVNFIIIFTSNTRDENIFSYPYCIFLNLLFTLIVVWGAYTDYIIATI